MLHRLMRLYCAVVDRGALELPTLSHWRVVVTRPQQQAGPIVDRLSRLGALVLPFPVIDIQFLPTAGLLTRNEVNRDALLIFVSRNAVAAGLRALADAGVDVDHSCSLFAVGPATAELVTSLTGAKVEVPKELFSTEGLLGLLSESVVSGRRVYIFCGESPRPLLGETLAQRGGTVREINVYRRTCPIVDTGELIKHWQQDRATCVMLTSVEAAKNFKHQLGPAFVDTAATAPLVVAGHRIETACRRLGYHGDCAVARSATDADMIEALENLKPTTRQTNG